MRVTQGRVFDVAVDLRRSSPTFGEWVGVELNGEEHQQLWVPPGCAHGFVVLSEVADFQYKTTDYYAPEYERCLRWDDPSISIRWPDSVVPKLSDKDQQGEIFANCETYP